MSDAGPPLGSSRIGDAVRDVRGTVVEPASRDGARHSWADTHDALHDPWVVVLAVAVAHRRAPMGEENARGLWA